MARIETVPEVDCDDILARVLAPLDAPTLASRVHIRSFKNYMAVSSLHWSAWRCMRHRRISACLFVIFLPGKTAIAMLPRSGKYEHERKDLQLLLEHVLTGLAGNRLHYLQTLVDPRDATKHDLLLDTGFTRLTQLIYMQRPVTGVTSKFSPQSELTWISYNQQQHDSFADVLAATYVDSHDCPELSGTRPMEDVIASHKAAGKFNPAMWEIASIDHEYVGCILLAPLTHGSVLEIVYMGVCPDWRRKGIGQSLLSRALDQARQYKMTELTTVVDCRNEPARQLYMSFGFTPTAQREAFLYHWQ